MNTAGSRVLTFNGELTAACPEGFHVMTKEEKAATRVLAEGPWEGLSDPERHILVTIGWRQLGLFGSFIFSARTLSRVMEDQISNAMKSYGYRFDGSEERSIAGSAAFGFRYGYTAKENPMYAESYVLKRGRTVYYLHVYAREALREESVPAWNGFLDSIAAK